jgi:hypothetical protein
MALIGAWLWDEGVVLIGAFLFVCAIGGALCTAWVVVGSLLAAVGTAAGLMRDEE